MLDTLIGWDKAATLWINGHYSPLTDQVWFFLSSVKVWFPLYAALAWMFIRRLGWRRGMVAIIALSLSTLVCDQTGNLVKNSVCRLRPCYDSLMIGRGLHILEGRGNHFGFFSAHAANAFSLACCTLLCFRQDRSHHYVNYALFAFLWAFLIAASRIFAGKHYLGDVIAGALVGIFFGCLFGYLARKISSRLWPQRRYEYAKGFRYRR